MKRNWWKEGIVYQIYPRSFNDSNDDGIGDLPGIIEKLDYLEELGIDIIWLSPVYESPNDDNGYDISNYYGIMKEFGTMEDMERLISEVHKRGMRIIMDLVVNHTSDEHPWFIQSRSSRDNPYRDFYIWKDGRGEGPPNNWGSWFGGPAWEYDDKTGQYYLHIFSKKQPDLNWENPRLRQEIYKMMRWWLDKGIDGFRMDVINLISKVEGMPDGEQGENDRYGDGSPYFINGPRIHEFLQEMNREVLSAYDIMTVGETPGVTPEIAARYVNHDRHELNMLFHFELMELDCGSSKWEEREWQLTELKAVINKWYRVLREKGWNSFYLNNHDQPRMVSRFGDDGLYRKESAKMLATMLLTLPGTPYLYQGEEIGMTNTAFERIEDYRDIETINWYRERLKEGRDEKEIIKAIHRISRDNARTPMQWSDGPNAGFTGGTPWIKANPNYREINAASSLKDPDSILNYYKRLIRLRKDEKNLALIYGDYHLILEGDQRIYSYLRELNGERFLIILNFSEERPVFRTGTGQPAYSGKELLIANYPVGDKEEIEGLVLRPYEARIYRLM